MIIRARSSACPVNDNAVPQMPKSKFVSIAARKLQVSLREVSMMYFSMHTAHQSVLSRPHESFRELLDF